jgi:flavin reductase (DIM6/NTAB) family NADH-FMN oxidoreductase RutF
MTKPFEPGADRLAKVSHKDSEISGCPIIEGANAVLDCTVVSAASCRMLLHSRSM